MRTMKAHLLLNVLLAAMWLKVDAYSMYKGYIPNGDRIPNPCNRSTIWPGVGHENVYGSGTRNLFGLDFSANDHVWNKTLCEKDSDGDGMTNAEELGDPHCIWTNGSIPSFTINLSHPGVCEPIGSSLCTGKNSWLMDCKPVKLNCPAIEAPEVRNFTLRFPVTPVLAKETTLMCNQFALPNDVVSDIIAIEPVIDNALVLHHMLFFATAVKPIDQPDDKPFECEMGGQSSGSLLSVWSVGIAGHCLNSQLGFRIGPGGFQYATIKMHWNNPQNTMNLTDSSGLRIYYTTQLRPNLGQVSMMGQNYLEIPPGQKDVTFTGTCSLCTKRLNHSLFLTSSYIHMHLLGKAGEVRLSRNGNLVQILDSVTNYDYNTPKLAEFTTPIEVKPGDEIQVKCVYQSTTRNSTTYYGKATSDEMCYSFLTYYPSVGGFGYCGQYKSINVCNTRFDAEFEPCDISTFLKLIAYLPDLCAANCTSTPCAVIMDGIYATGCQNYPEVTSFIRDYHPTYRPLFEQCSAERPPRSTTDPSGQGLQCTQKPQSSHSSGLGDSFYFAFIITFLSSAFVRE